MADPYFYCGGGVVEPSPPQTEAADVQEMMEESLAEESPADELGTEEEITDDV